MYTISIPTTNNSHEVAATIIKKSLDRLDTMAHPTFAHVV